MEFLDILGIILVFAIIGGICALIGRLSEYIELARDKRKKEKAKQYYREHKAEIDAFINSQSNFHIYRKKEIKKFCNNCGKKITTNEELCDNCKIKILKASDNSFKRIMSKENTISQHEEFNKKININVNQILKRIDDLVLSSVPDEEPDPDMPIGEYVIKTSPIARLDFLLFMFFDLYCAFGQFRNGNFVKHFNLEFEKALKDYFSNDVDENTIERIFDDRLTKYDAIMRSDIDDKDKALTDQIEHFLKNDLWSNDIFDERLFIVGDTKKLSLRIEIISLYENTYKTIYPLASELAEIATKYRSQGYFVAE